MVTLWQSNFIDQCWFRVNNRDDSLEAFNAWYADFFQSLTILGWISLDQALNGLDEQEFSSLLSIGFYDVSMTQWYTKPVKWAIANGITSGTGDCAFSPNSVCTRAQIVTFLYHDLASLLFAVGNWTLPTLDHQTGKHGPAGPCFAIGKLQYCSAHASFDILLDFLYHV